MELKGVSSNLALRRVRDEKQYTTIPTVVNRATQTPKRKTTWTLEIGKTEKV